MITLSHVYKFFGNHEVLKDVNLTVREGEKLVIIGPSGSGKSTTVRCMNGLEMPTSGQVFINGTELTKKNRIEVVRSTSAMVFQQFNLYPHLSVLENLTLAPMKLFKKSRREAEEMAYHYLDVVGLVRKAQAYPAVLSGGQQQRVGIARALAVDPQIIFADEPTGNLDSKTTKEILGLMRKIVREQNQTLVMVTHDNYIAGFADRQLHIVDGKIFKIEEQHHDDTEEDTENEEER